MKINRNLPYFSVRSCWGTDFPKPGVLCIWTIEGRSGVGGWCQSGALSTLTIAASPCARVVHGTNCLENVR